ncbi:tRNA lysidine(34) synthetase TilS [Aurantiacibacter spongiae]|uniref:tRNA lysidine(34) synthetase TilS n=1 Tax=Aurantiacibacter spongiae TaxID=2488860 RepID=UPI001F17BCB9|nr:tRNA lysidine(34) synthetase TilS [Aurantiacibacter spongiae]
MEAASTAPDPALVERFGVALDRLGAEGKRIGLAVSGGPDSMAMLLLACEAMPGMFEVATVDHGLRPESADECALVVRACAGRGVPCEVLRVDVGDGNVQAGAREARYAALSEWAIRRDLAVLATAHHADDQAETLLMRLGRGSGVAGLAGVREARSIADGAVLLIRPLLHFRREELHSVLREAGQEAASDPSNADERYDRARIRRALAAAPWLDPLAVAKSAQLLAEADEALAFVAETHWQSHSFREGEGDGGEQGEREGGALLVRLHAARLVRLRLIARALAEFGGRARGGAVAELDTAIVAGNRANLAGVVAERVERAGGAYLRFTPEPPRRRA